MMRPVAPMPTIDAADSRRPSRPPSSGLRAALLTVCGLALVAIAAASIALGMAHARTVRYPRPSVAIAQGAGATGVVGQPLAFRASARAGSQLVYHWDFGDGARTAASAGASVSHTYATYGAYTVSVVAADPLGQTTTADTRVTIRPTPPVAAFTATASAGFFEECVVFDASTSTGAELTYAWDFADGNTTTGSSNPQVEDCYARAGTYPVTLTVTDVAGQVSTVTHPVVIRLTP